MPFPSLFVLFLLPGFCSLLLKMLLILELQGFYDGSDLKCPPKVSYVEGDWLSGSIVGGPLAECRLWVGPWAWPGRVYSGPPLLLSYFPAALR